MAPKLKDHFDRRLVERIAEELHDGCPKLDRARFVAEALDGLDRLELIQRGWHVAEVMQRHLPAPFPRAARMVAGAFPPPAPPPDERDARDEDDAAHPMESFRYLPHAFWVAKYGLDHFDAAMAFQHALTQRFTAEFSLRPFLDRDLTGTLAVLRGWATDPSPHVRRLVSEGTRPRLPWAPRVRALQQDPRPVLPLLELLRDDPALYVRRSVANHLNDIGKDHPALLTALCGRWWQDAPEPRRWVIRHGLRSLVKASDAEALSLLGYGAAARLTVRNVVVEPARPRIGDTVRFSAELVSRAREAQPLLVDFAVHFVKARGGVRPKVFKLTRLALPPGGAATVRGRVSLQQRTTRTHHPGEHRLELRVNGVTHPLGTFLLRPARSAGGQARQRP